MTLLLNRLLDRFPQHYSTWIETTKDFNPWHLFLHRISLNSSLISGLFLTICVSISINIEQKNNFWKRLLVMPKPFFSIISAKLLLLIWFSLLLNLLLYGVNFILFKSLLAEEHKFIFSDLHLEDKKGYLFWALFFSLTTYKMIVFHFWLSLKMNNLQILAFIIGCIGTVTGFSFVSPYGTIFPISLNLDGLISALIVSTVYIFVFIYFLKKDTKVNFFTE